MWTGERFQGPHTRADEGVSVAPAAAASHEAAETTLLQACLNRINC